MKMALRCFFLIVLLGSCGVTRPAHAWQELKGEHFIIYLVNDDSFGRDVLRASEKAYQDIATNLGYPRTSEFWTWDRRVKIYLHKNKPDYIKASGMTEWSEGMADYAKREIHSYIGCQELLNTTLPHEIAHLILRDFVGFGDNIPVWLDEGVAQWAENDTTKMTVKQRAAELYDRDNLLSLKDIFSMNIRWIAQQKKRLFLRWVKTKYDTPTVLVLSADVLIDTFYITSGSLVGYLLETFGATRFSDFCRELRDGKTVEEAIAVAYPDHFKNIAELEAGWRESLLKSMELASS
jgi:hypothetical protein